MGWDDGIWDGIWDGMGVGILPFPLIWVASILINNNFLFQKVFYNKNKCWTEPLYILISSKLKRDKCIFLKKSECEMLQEFPMEQQYMRGLKIEIVLKNK